MTFANDQWQEAIVAQANGTASGATTIADGGDTTQGAEADTALTTAASSGTLMAFTKGLVKILADVWDSTNHLFHLNLKQVGGNAVAVGSNAVPVLSTAATGYVAAYGSNPANTGTANTDATFKWGAGGNTQVNHIMVQNNSGANLLYDLDTASTSASLILSSTAGANTIFIDVQTTVFHMQSANANVPINAASGILIRGWL